MLRATIIQSALGDPTEILQGQVQVPPRRLALGEPLRLKLNRAARPGTVLQLMSPRQEVVALLNVDDDDEKGRPRHLFRSPIFTVESSSWDARPAPEFRVFAIAPLGLEIVGLLSPGVSPRATCQRPAGAQDLGGLRPKASLATSTARRCAAAGCRAADSGSRCCPGASRRRSCSGSRRPGRRGRRP